MLNLRPFFELIRLHRPIPILLLLWPVYTALWLAHAGLPNVKNLAIFGLGAFIMRSAGCILNDLADHNFDGHVDRTQARPLATGALTKRQAKACLFALLSFAFILFCLLSLKAQGLALIALLLACLYPLAKRYFSCPQLVLGATYNMGILIAFAHVQNTLPWVAWMLYMGTLFWTLAYDSFYASVDLIDDIKLNLHSSVRFFGRYTQHMIVICQLIAWLSFSSIGLSLSHPLRYSLVMLALPLCFFYQHTVWQQNPKQNGLRAFSLNHWVGLLVFLGVVLSL